MGTGGMRDALVGALLAALTLAVSPLLAEPEGSVRWDATRVEASDGSRLRLVVVPVIDVEDSAIAVVAPRGLDVEPARRADDFATAPGERGRPVRRAMLGRLVAGRGVVLEFTIAAAAPSASVVEFVLEGTDPRGRAVREAFGVVVGPRHAGGVVRHGAIEFPAGRPEAAR